jgi:hypothetical protein
MADGTRVNMNAVNVSVSCDQEILNHRSFGRSAPDMSVVINQEFRIEAVGPGLTMHVDGRNEPTSLGVPAPPTAMVDILPPREEMSKQALMRVIRMSRRDDGNSTRNVESSGASDSEVVRGGEEPSIWSELEA